MRATLLLLTACCALATASGASAADVEFQLAPHAGEGHLRIDIPQRAALTPDTFGAGVTAGVLLPPGIVLQAGLDRYGHYTFFGLDEFRFDQEYVAAGYQFELGRGWRIVPTGGWAYWKLDRFGFLVHRADEQSLSGHDAFWGLSVQKRISRRVALGAAYQQGNYDFGRQRTTSFVATFGF